MKKVFFAIVLVSGGWSFSHATNLFGINADNITRGTLDPARLNASSVTMRDPTWDEAIDAATATLRTTIANATTSISNVKRDYDLYVGTPGTSGNVDVIANETNSFNSAFASVPVNARGLTINTSAHATIFV